MIKLPQLNISFKMNLVVIGSLLLFLLVPCLFIVNAIFKDFEQHVELNNRYITKLASEIYFHPLLENDFAAIMSLTLGFLQDDKIVNIAVYNDKGINVVPLNANKGQNALFTHQYQQNISIGGNGDIEKGLPIGKVAITFNMDAHYREVEQAQIIFISLFITALIVTMILISMMLRRFIKRPIDELSHSVAQVKIGILDQQAQVIAKDEIGDLAMAFNDMTSHINTVSRALSDSKKVAEDALEETISTQQQLVHSEKMASLGTLTAGVAHEINNPTNFVHVSAQNLELDLSRFQQFLFALMEDEDEGDSEIIDSFKQQFVPLYEHLDTIIDGTRRIKIIVQDLRAFTQLDSTEKKMVDILASLNSTIKLVKTNYLQLAEFRLDLQPLPALLCNPAQLNQVFLNLIINACDAIRDKLRKDDPDLSKPFNKGLVEISCLAVDNNIVISVSDNGCGMDEITKSRLFEPFFTTKKIGEGTGLGLSISYGIIQKHQGTLTVDSQPGVGTRFTSSLPVQ